jgi:ribosomal protein L12E/L44/L45/RPP1/RPP2
MPTVILDNGSELLDERLPEIDPDKAVIPTVNVPLEVLVQKMVDKALSEKDKSELTRSEVFPGTVTMTPEEAEASAKADAEATEAAAKDQNEVKNP